MFGIDIKCEVLPIQAEMTQGGILHGRRSRVADRMAVDRTVSCTGVDGLGGVRHAPVIGAGGQTAKKFRRNSRAPWTVVARRTQHELSHPSPRPLPVLFFPHLVVHLVSHLSEFGEKRTKWTTKWETK